MNTKDTENYNKQFPKLYEKLPEHLGGSAEFVGPEKVKEFLKKHVPKSDQKEINEVFSKNLPLAQQEKKKIANVQPKKLNKYLTAREKRDLKLAKIGKFICILLNFYVTCCNFHANL